MNLDFSPQWEWPYSFSNGHLLSTVLIQIDQKCVMCVCVSVYACECVWVHVYVCEGDCECMWVCVHVYGRVVDMSVCISVSVCVWALPGNILVKE